jgi:RNA polymerase sigma-70 factor (ECF subfamily)
MNTAEFSQLLETNRDVLFRFALKLSRNYQDAQDLFQDAVVRGYKYRQKFQMGTNFRAWMSTIIRNTMITKSRKKRRLKVASEPIETYTFAIESKNIVSNQAEISMRMQEIFNMMDHLPEIHKVPFLLHYKGYEYKEIAEKMGIPIGTVKSRLNTARTLLKELIQKESDFNTTVN